MQRSRLASVVYTANAMELGVAQPTVPRSKNECFKKAALLGSKHGLVYTLPTQVVHGGTSDFLFWCCR